MNPLIVSRPTSPPPVVIERIIADDVAYYGEETVSLPAGTRRIQIDFSALRFNSMGRVVFRYRLGGVDKDWIQRPGSQNSATYTNPGPGDLWFTIAASVNGGPWSERPATLRITVGRYFYQEPWLQVAGGLALIGLVVGAYRWRTRRVRERNRQLEAEVQRRIEAETKIRTSLDEKTVMLKEIHHRVKNNLQIISSLFSLQFGSSNDPMVQEMLKESQTRIRSMALVHEALYRSNNLAAIDFREYVQGLAAQIAHTHQRGNVRIQFAGEPITLSLDQAIPAGLIMNEALSNAYKHAFPGNGEGVITVHFRNDEDAHVELAVSDTGRGLPEGFDPSAVPSLGFHLILALTEQLSGTLSINGKPGTRIAVRFPVV
jgi:two-component sensor histidine kinase